MTTYVEQEFSLDAIFGLLFQKDVAHRVNNEDLAVLSHDTLLRSLRTRDQLCFNRSANALNSSFPCSLHLFPFLLLLLHGALLTAVSWDHFVRGVFWGIGVELLAVHSGSGSSIDAWDARDGRLIAPSSPACMSDVSLDEFSSALPPHEECKVMEASAHDDQKTKDNRAEPRAKALVVVAGSPPSREAVSQEVIIALSLGTLEDIGNYRQPLVARRDLLHVRVDLLLGGALGDLDTGCPALLLVVLGIVCDKELAGLVGVEFAGLLAVGLGQFVLRGTRLDAEQVVEGDVGALGGSDLIAEAEDFVVCTVMSAGLAALAGCVHGRMAGTRRGQVLRRERLGLRTLFCPGSSKRGKEAQGQRNEGVCPHGWGGGEHRMWREKDGRSALLQLRNKNPRCPLTALACEARLRGGGLGQRGPSLGDARQGPTKVVVFK